MRRVTVTTEKYILFVQNCEKRRKPTMAPRSIVMGSLSFKSVTQAKKFISDKLSSLPVGPVPAEENHWLQALVQNHHNPEKQLRDVLSFVIVNTGRGFSMNINKCFAAVTDPVKEPISFSYKNNYIITPDPPKELIADVFRFEIKDQVNEMTNEAFRSGETVRCAVTGQELLRKDVHVDHNFDGDNVTFQDLLNEFLLQQGLTKKDCEEMKLVSGTHGRKTFADRTFAQRWFDFHKERAVLRFTHKTENMSGKKRVREHF